MHDTQSDDTIPEQSWEEAHFFLSSTDSRSCFFDDLPHPEVSVPSLEKARITIGELGTLLGLGVSMSGTWKKYEI